MHTHGSPASLTLGQPSEGHVRCCLECEIGSLSATLSILNFERQPPEVTAAISNLSSTQGYTWVKTATGLKLQRCLLIPPASCGLRWMNEIQTNVKYKYKHTLYFPSTSLVNPYLREIDFELVYFFLSSKIQLVAISFLSECTSLYKEVVLICYLRLMIWSSWFPRLRCTSPGYTSRKEKRMRRISMESLPLSTKSPLKTYGVPWDGIPF